MEIKNSFTEAMKAYRVPRLEHLATVKISFILIIESVRELDISGDSICEEKVSKMVERMLLPEVIRSYFRLFTPVIVDEINTWLWFIRQKVLSSEQAIGLYHLNCLVLWGRGDVNYEQTGRNLLQNAEGGSSGISNFFQFANILDLDFPRTTDQHKYGIASRFCLEDEALSRAPLQDGYAERLREISLDHMEEFYFACVKGGKHHLLAEEVNGLNLSRREQRTAHSFLMDNARYNANGEFMKYVWNQMNDTEKVESLCELFGNSYLRANVLFHMLTHSNESVIESVLTTRTDSFTNIVYTFARSPLYFEFVSPFIFGFFRFITADVLKEVLQFMYGSHLSLRGTAAACDSFINICAEVWVSVPPDFKREFLGNTNMFTYLVNKGKLRFARCILGDCGDAQRRQTIRSLATVDMCANLIRSRKKKIFNAFVEELVPLGEPDTRLFKEAVSARVYETLRDGLYVSQYTFKKLLECMISDESGERTGPQCHYTDMCEKIWSFIDDDYRRFVFEDEPFSVQILCYLLRNEVWSFVRKLLADARDPLRKQMISSDAIFGVCLSWVKERKWELVYSASVFLLFEGYTLEHFRKIGLPGAAVGEEFEIWFHAALQRGVNNSTFLFD